MLSYHTMSKTCEPLAASVKHSEKLCVRMHECVCVFLFDVDVQPRVVEIRRFLCQQIDIVAFRGPIILICWNVNFLLKPSYERKSWLCRKSSWPIFCLVLRWYNISAVTPVSCTKYCFLGSSVRVKCVRMSELNKTDMRPWLWQERLPARLRASFSFFLLTRWQKCESLFLKTENKKPSKWKRNTVFILRGEGGISVPVTQ